MHWVIGGLVLVVVGAVMRTVLGLDSVSRQRPGGLVPLRPGLQAIYSPIAQEIEAHAIILGITLNDGFNEREANRHEMAWRMVSLANGEWDRLRDLVAGLQKTLAQHLPTTNVVVPVRRVTASNFKSRAVIDHVALYEFMDQIVFSSKQRFGLRLRVLFRACTLLTQEFRHTYHEGTRSMDASPEVWDRLDHYFHDFDLIAKETLLTLRTLLACQSPRGAQAMARDLQTLLERGVRVSVPAAMD